MLTLEYLMATLAVNKRALFDYEILETLEAGIELKGFEVKSMKNGRVQITGSYAIPRGRELYLIGGDIPAYQPHNAPQDYDSKRPRRLLLNKNELQHLYGKLKEKGLTAIPLELYTKGKRGFIKIKIGIGRSRKKHDKRELLKKRETEKEIRKEE